MSKFKVGDQVVIISSTDDEGKRYEYGEKYIGVRTTILAVDNGDVPYRLQVDGMNWPERDIQLINGENIMVDANQVINSNKTTDEQLLIDQGITENSGALTSEGRVTFVQWLLLQNQKEFAAAVKKLAKKD